MDIQLLSASVKETAPARGASWGHLSSDAVCGISIWSYLPSQPGDIRSGGLADLSSEQCGGWLGFGTRGLDAVIVFFVPSGFVVIICMDEPPQFSIPASTIPLT